MDVVRLKQVTTSPQRCGYLLPSPPPLGKASRSSRRTLAWMRIARVQARQTACLDWVRREPTQVSYIR